MILFLNCTNQLLVLHRLTHPTTNKGKGLVKDYTSTMYINSQGFIQRRGEGGISPLIRFRAKYISTYNNISATSLLGHQKPPEATSERPTCRLKHFLGERTPDPPAPQEQCTSHDQFFPLPNKILLHVPCIENRMCQSE